ncbi:ZGRF1 protein, partial [Cochlearius cochlearius]|nr:ZGRF1 protein [Cochlearius cochlearius]
LLLQHFTRFKQVLYTHQKMKKSKTWQDGILSIRTGGNKAILFDDKGQCLESIFIKSQVNAGDNLEGERYLITVEGVKVNEKSFEDQPRKAEAPAVDRNSVRPGVLPPRHLPVGLKRKFTGFQGPRQVEKKISATEDGENTTILPLSKQCQGAFPSKFYITSPLFSTICKQDAETNLSADLREDACTGNNREHMSLSSLLSAPLLDRCEEIEKQNSDGSLVKPESPLITGHAKSSSRTAGHGAASHIRSTAQIIALLKSKPTQGCREQTMSEVTECLSRFQASENTDSLYNKKSTILPAYSGNLAKRLVQNVQHLPFTKGTGNDKKEWNAEMLLNPAEQPSDKEVTGLRCDEKANSLSQVLQDPCNTNSCYLPESTISRTSGGQFVPSSGDVWCSVSPITFRKNLSRYREHSGSDGLQENSSVKLQSELQLKQNSERTPSDLELSVDITRTEIGIGEEVAPNSASRLRSCCEVVTHSENEEVECWTFDGENDGNRRTEDTPSWLCDKVRDTGRTAEDSANQTRIEVELLGDGHEVKENNEGQLSIDATTNKKDPDGCAVRAVNGMSWIKSERSNLLPGDAKVNECHPKASTFEKTESISCISTSRIISAMGKRTEEDVTQLGCVKSPDVDLQHFWSDESDDIKRGSPLLALLQKPDPSYGSFQHIAEDNQKVFGISQKEDALISRSSLYPLGKGHSSPEETAIGESEFENVERINALGEACQGERIGTDCLKCTATAENSSGLPDLLNNIALLQALTQHSTALESLQKIEENNSILYG